MLGVIRFNMRKVMTLDQRGEQVDEMCYALSFKPFFEKSKAMLESLYKNYFRSHKMFSELLMEICATDALQKFYKTANITVSKKKAV